ncbi:MAG: hypothetical protein GY952_14105 [Rhodobacteraceae bacterium]|nr:hypothetical protein [Paracoccaceae bacterium]
MYAIFNGFIVGSVLILIGMAIYLGCLIVVLGEAHGMDEDDAQKSD